MNTIGRTNDIRGTFQLLDGATSEGIGCRGSGGYSDIRPGTEVTVRDQAGAVIARGDLGLESSGTVPGSCEFSLRVDDVPRATFYEIEVGRRGSLTYSYEQMQRQDWTVGFELGR